MDIRICDIHLLEDGNSRVASRYSNSFRKDSMKLHWHSCEDHKNYFKTASFEEVMAKLSQAQLNYGYSIVLRRVPVLTTETTATSIVMSEVEAALKRKVVPLEEIGKHV